MTSMRPPNVYCVGDTLRRCYTRYLDVYTCTNILTAEQCIRTRTAPTQSERLVYRHPRGSDDFSPANMFSPMTLIYVHIGLAMCLTPH